MNAEFPSVITTAWKRGWRSRLRDGIVVVLIIETIAVIVWVLLHG